LPFVTYHPEDQCSIVLSPAPIETIEDESLNKDEGIDNPFSILEQLKKQ
jgi:uncharacterized metal-binding protein YceD (DUF177 family)